MLLRLELSTTGSFEFIIQEGFGYEWTGAYLQEKTSGRGMNPDVETLQCNVSKRTRTQE
ncbi:hypothetical protein LC612_15835 [Nostoc sp. CHAB 5834]|nr:hypothetical protein [Nostoc sp. CHAB 5834]